MRFWKLGTIWGKGAPDFYDLIKEKKIVLSHTSDGDPKQGEMVLIAKGFTIKALGLLLEDARPITENPEWKDEFEHYKIDFDNRLLYARANWVELNHADRLWYQTQDGICQVHKQEITNKAKKLYKEYAQQQNMEQLIHLLQAKGQIILQGPPGTGKTYHAHELAYQMIFNAQLTNENEERSRQLKLLEASEQFRLVQFHPAYSYEDFVRGITAKANEGNIEYTVENKTIASLAKAAIENFESAHREPDENAKRRQIQDWVHQFANDLDIRLQNEDSIELTKKAEITEITADSIQYNGKSGWKTQGSVPYSDIIEMYYSELKSNQLIVNSTKLSGTGRGQPTYWRRVTELFHDWLALHTTSTKLPPVEERIVQKSYILIVDEINRANLPAVLGELIYALEYRDREVTSLYLHPFDGQVLRIPPNLYLIGTMNTADRSVGHIDYAIRRRFAFVDVLPDAAIITQPDAQQLFQKVDSLFHEMDGDKPMYLSTEFEPNQVRIGHSYFLATGDALKLKLEYEIKPILREYVRDGILNPPAKEEIEKLTLA